MIRTGQTNI
jgi:hypothetical protein